MNKQAFLIAIGTIGIACMITGMVITARHTETCLQTNFKNLAAEVPGARTSTNANTGIDGACAFDLVSANINCENGVYGQECRAYASWIAESPSPVVRCTNWPVDPSKTVRHQWNYEKHSNLKR